MSESSFSAARILIVDDEKANVLVLERMLARAGYNALFSTEDSRRFEELFAQTQPDLILLDLLMPHRDGYQVLEVASQIVPAGAYLPVMVLTADITPQALQRALTAGAHDFLTKPFDQNELLLRVHNLLETRFLHLSLQAQLSALAGMYDSSQQSLLLRNESLSAASHDMNQPLVALRFSVDSAQRELERLEPAARSGLSEDIERMAAATGQLTAMIGELADVASLQMGRGLALQRRRIDLVKLASAQLATARKLSPKHRLRLVAPQPELFGDWDEARLSRVIGNLLGNAVKFSPRGGPIELWVGPIEREGSAWACLRVSDHGLGVPAEDLPRIFERFYRSAAASRVATGSGIGLASVKHIVEQHGGAVEVESEQGEGATFTVLLPLQPA